MEYFNKEKVEEYKQTLVGKTEEELMAHMIMLSMKMNKLTDPMEVAETMLKVAIVKSYVEEN